MEEKADEACKHYLEKSLEYDAENPESLQLMASYWLSKENIDEAKKCIIQSVDSWLPKYIELSNGKGEACLDPAQVVPMTYDSRINTSRILTEVQEYDKSISVLEQLIEEDDEVVVVWYMLGWVNFLKGEDYFSNAKFYLKKANQVSFSLNLSSLFSLKAIIR
jgi:tetratricopeptide (TPR) repeat protein